MTAAQRQALDTLWPKFGVADDTAEIEFETLFGRDAPTIVEIGFGDGGALLAMARADPAINFLGIEVYRPGVGRLLMRLEEDRLNNVRVVIGDAVDVLTQRIADTSLDAVHIFFPDPWPKKRHHKRRLLQAGLVTVLANKLRAGGRLHIATDWQDYADHIVEMMDAQAEFENVAGADVYSPRPDYRPLTKYEKRGQRLGHRVYDLIYRRR